MLRWSDGARDYGCTYHKRGVGKIETDDLVVDVFVMPSIARERPIAITVGRYRSYKPVKKEKWQISHPADLDGVLGDLQKALENLGVTEGDIEGIIGEIELVLHKDARLIKEALASVNHDARVEF